VLELEELIAVDGRPHVERAKRSRTCGWVEDDEHTRNPLAEVEHRPLKQPGAEVDGDARLPVLALRIEDLPLVGVDRPARAQRRDALSFELARNGVRRPEARIGLGPLLGEAAPSQNVRRLSRR